MNETKSFNYLFFGQYLFFTTSYLKDTLNLNFKLGGAKKKKERREEKKTLLDIIFKQFLITHVWEILAKLLNLGSV